MVRHDKSDFKTINKIERYFICHDPNDIQWYFWPFRLPSWKSSKWNSYDDFISHAMEEKIFFRKDDDMNIKYISVENSIAEWADKKGILKRWDGLNQYTLNRWIKEMRENRTFSMYVINPTHKLVFINLEGFESFLRWKQKRTK